MGDKADRVCVLFWNLPNSAQGFERADHLGIRLCHGFITGSYMFVALAPCGNIHAKGRGCNTEACIWKNLSRHAAGKPWQNLCGWLLAFLLLTTWGRLLEHSGTFGHLNAKLYIEEEGSTLTFKLQQEEHPEASTAKQHAQHAAIRLATWMSHWLLLSRSG